jgi:hypothetical protein
LTRRRFTHWEKGVDRGDAYELRRGPDTGYGDSRAANEP